jgi:hypothetical protein
MRVVQRNREDELPGFSGAESRDGDTPEGGEEGVIVIVASLKNAAEEVSALTRRSLP